MSREVLSPPILHMSHNRNYRVNYIPPDSDNEIAEMANGYNRESPQQGYVEQDLYAEDDDEDDLEDCKIEEMERGIFKLTMHVAQAFYGGLIGFKGNTKRRIENETHTDIFIPKNQLGTGRKDENVVIKGQSRSNVCSARRQIKLIIASLRKRMPATHFIGVALNYGEIREKFLEFKKRILESNYPGIEDILFISDARLHITLSVCVLLDDVERKKAIELLQESRHYLDGLTIPFEIKVSGLEIMNDDPSAVRVVYAMVEAPDLQRYADLCLDAFEQCGLSKDEFGRNTVKMHMTVLNVKFRTKENPNSPNTFDAREIMKNFGNFYFGRTHCEEVELCIRGTYVEDGASRGFYKRSSVVKIVKHEI